MRTGATGVASEGVEATQGLSTVDGHTDPTGVEATIPALVADRILDRVVKLLAR